MSFTSKVMLGLFAAMLVVAGYVRLLGDGELHVLLNEGQLLEVTIDGRPAVVVSNQGRHRRYVVEQGDHEVRLKDMGSGQERTWSVFVRSGFTQLVLPVSEQQCFTRINVTTAMYKGTNPYDYKPPTISGRYEATGAFELESQTYFSTEELPKKLKSKSEAHLLVPTSCALLNLEDRQLIRMAGF